MQEKDIKTGVVYAVPSWSSYGARGAVALLSPVSVRHASAGPEYRRAEGSQTQVADRVVGYLTAVTYQPSVSDEELVECATRLRTVVEGQARGAAFALPRTPVICVEVLQAQHIVRTWDDYKAVERSWREEG